MLPAKVIVPPAQTVCVDPALAVAGAFTVITTVEETAEQGPLPSGSLVVKVNVTLPLDMLGVYVEVSKLALENVPLGAVQVELVALPPRVPANVTVPPAQTVCAEPALTVAAAFTVITTVEVAPGQGSDKSGSFVVKVNVTVPLAIVGVYVEVSELALENEPLGADHVELVALPPMLPANAIVPPAQTVCARPASAVAGFTVTDKVAAVEVTVPLILVNTALYL